MIFRIRFCESFVVFSEENLLRLKQACTLKIFQFYWEESFRISNTINQHKFTILWALIFSSVFFLVLLWVRTMNTIDEIIQIVLLSLYCGKRCKSTVSCLSFCYHFLSTKLKKWITRDLRIQLKKFISIIFTIFVYSIETLSEGDSVDVGVWGGEGNSDEDDDFSDCVGVWGGEGSSEENDDGGAIVSKTVVLVMPTEVPVGPEDPAAPPVKAEDPVDPGGQVWSLVELVSVETVSWSIVVTASVVLNQLIVVPVTSGHVGQVQPGSGFGDVQGACVGQSATRFKQNGKTSPSLIQVGFTSTLGGRFSQGGRVCAVMLADIATIIAILYNTFIFVFSNWTEII